MSWADFYLTCFLIGLILSVIAFLLGTMGFGEAGGHAATDLSLDTPADVVAGVSHGPAHGGVHVSPLNFSTAMVFLAWFGATGYLLTRFSGIWSLFALAIAMIIGTVGAAAVFWFLVKVLVAHDHTMRIGDSRIEGALGTVVMPIREGRIGEIVFTLGGTRQTAGARSDDDRALEQGAEVVITGYRDGIAYVRALDETDGAERRTRPGEART